MKIKIGVLSIVASTIGLLGLLNIIIEKTATLDARVVKEKSAPVPMPTADDTDDDD